MANNLLGARAKHVNIRAGIKQRGVTLLELIAGLAVMAVIVVGALALFNTANNAQRATQLKTDIEALRAGVTQLWMGQGNYGTVNLAPTLHTAGRIPGTVRVTGSGAATTLTHAANGTFEVRGATTRFTIQVNGLTSALCVELSTGPHNWNSVQINMNAAILPAAFPIAPAMAAGQCTVAGSGNHIIFTGS